MYFPSRPPSRRFPTSPPAAQSHAYPTTASAAVHVRYLYLAGRYRDLSSEHGLGIAAGLDQVVEEERNRSASKRQSTGAAEHPRSSSATFQHAIFLGASTATTSPPRKERQHAAAAPHGAKHASLRGYALERLKRQEKIEARIMRATDVKRLEWEAQAALLQSSHPLAILLLSRAGNLGSISACASLARLYTLGVTRGTLPAVVLVHRDPLRACAWALEAFRLLRASEEGSNAARSRSSRTLETPDSVRLLALLTRVLRTDQAAPADPHNVGAIELPETHLAPALCSTGPMLSPPLAHARTTDLWGAVRELDAWLNKAYAPDVVETDLEPETPGPDEEDEATLAAQQTRSLRLLACVLRALLHTRDLTCGDIEAAQTKASWDAACTQAHEAVATKVPGANEVLTLAKTVLAVLSDTIPSLTQLAAVLEGSLAELAVPTALSASVRGNASVDTSDVESIGSIRSPNGSLRGTPKKVRPAVRKRRSLEDLPPLTIEAAAAQRPALSTRVLSEAPAPSSTLSDVIAAPEAPSPSSAALTALAARRPGAANTLSSLRLNTRPAATQYSASYTPEPPSPADSIRSTASGFAFSSAGRDQSRHGGAASTYGFPRQRRPSSVVSDSPSLLFPPSGAGEEDDVSSASHGARPASPAASMMDFLTTQGSLFRGASDGVALLPSQDRRRVASLYGAPSASASEVDVSDYGWGTKGASSGLVQSPSASSERGTGYFDPTASLRRMAAAGSRRRDSNASMSSIGSVRSLFNPPSAVAGMGTLRSPSTRGFGSGMGGGGFELGGGPRRGASAAEESAQAQISGSASFGRQAADSLRRLGILGGESSRADVKGLWSGADTASRSGEPRRRTASTASVPAQFLGGASTSRRRAPAALAPKPARPLSTISPTISSLDAQLSPTSSTASPIVATGSGLTSPRTAEASASALKTLRAVGERARPRTQALVLENLFPAGADSVPASPLSSIAAASAPISPIEEGEPYAAGRLPSHKQRHALPPRELNAAWVRQNSGGGRSFAGIDPTHGAYATGSEAGSGATTPNLLSPTTGTAGSRSASGTTSPTSSSHSCGGGGAADELDPALAAAESRSRLKTDARCDVCGRQVVNAPVSRSGRKFCGRECRVKDKAREKEERARLAAAVDGAAMNGHSNGAIGEDMKVDKGKGREATTGTKKAVEDVDPITARAVRFT